MHLDMLAGDKKMVRIGIAERIKTGCNSHLYYDQRDGTGQAISNRIEERNRKNNRRGEMT